MTKTVLVPIANGSEEIEAVCTIDTLARAGAEVTVASVENDKTCTMAKGVVLVANKLMKECENQTFDVIAVPGGPGAEKCRDCAVLTKLLKEQKKAGRLCAAICASPAVVFEHHGILEGETAVAYPMMMEKLKNPGKGRVVVSNNCITSLGPGSALEYAIKIVELLYDQQTAEKIKTQLCMP